VEEEEEEEEESSCEQRVRYEIRKVAEPNQGFAVWHNGVRDLRTK
jgi:hypothetical protein